MAPYYRALDYERRGEWALAMREYEEHSATMQKMGNVMEMSRGWCHMGHVLSHLGEPEKALIHYDRALQLAREAKSKASEGRAMHGMGRSFEMQAQHRSALRWYDRALRLFRELKDRKSEAAVYRSKAQTFETIADLEGARINSEMADDIENHVHKLAGVASDMLDKYRDRLGGATAVGTEPVPLERVTSSVPRIRREIFDIRRYLEKAAKKRRKYEKKEAITTLPAMSKPQRDAVPVLVCA